MRLNAFVNKSEMDGIKEICDMISERCIPFVNDLMKGPRNTLIWSGRNKSDRWFEGQVRKNRNPLNTKSEIHKIVDSMMLKKFGFRARSNVIFCIGSERKTFDYGNSYSIWPIGKYKFVYSNEVDDLFLELGKGEYYQSMGDENTPSDEEFNRGHIKWAEKRFKKLINTYRTDSIWRGAQSMNEIMVHCDRYIAVSSELSRDVASELYDRSKR